MAKITLITHEADIKVLTVAPNTLVAELLVLPNLASQQRYLDDCVPLVDTAVQDEVADELKIRSEQFLRSDIQRCLNVADLILYMANLTNNLWHRALGLRVKANAFGHGGLGQYQEAIELYDEAAQIYENFGHVVHQAGTQFAKLTPLARLGRYDEALEIGRWASQVFEENGERLLLAKLMVNLGILHRILGKDSEALRLYDKARNLYQELEGNPEAVLALGRVEQNRALILRHLGRFEEAKQASQTAWEMLTNSGQRVEAARAQQNLAITYFVLGQYNEALTLLDEARDVFLDDGRRRDAILIELFTSDCLLQLRRFKEVLHKCREVRTLFTELGVRFEVAQSILNEAVAYAGLARYEEALDALAETRRLFVVDGNNVWVASTDMETAAVLLRQGRAEESLEKALVSADVFDRHSLPVEKSQSLIIAARAAFDSDKYEYARQLITKALTIAESQNVPALKYQGHYLQGLLAAAKNDLPRARIEYDEALVELERLRGRLMLEFRADFLEDKQVVYEKLVQICLEMDKPDDGLAYAERAKSRALLELLAFRLNLGLTARDDADQPLVAELTRLRSERDRLYRRWQGDEVASERGAMAVHIEGQHQAQQEILTLEKKITDMWHKLLIRNADYARDAALWQVRNEPVQPYLDDDAALIEYFITQGQIVVFLVTNKSVKAHRLGVKVQKIQHLLQLLWLNLRAVPKSTPQQIPHLTKNAHGLLKQLSNHLISPISSSLKHFRHLIVVPHGPLHYLPFHALHDDTEMLLSRFEMSYLPSASCAGFIRKERLSGDGPAGLVAMGHSYQGKLPFTSQEAQIVAGIWQGQLYLDDDATLVHLQEAGPDCHILHLATHADFRPDNPIFSGLALADGWLTTLDIFNLRLQASLVTLSACQTGRSVVSGGDELLGLMRAFLSAGAASLLLSHWAVEDRSTALFMEAFYTKLAQGMTKGAALKAVQIEFVQGHSAQNPIEAALYRHPYFWAPFYLVGDAGSLS